MTTYTADDFKRAEFARHQELGYLAMRVPRKGRGAWINSKGGELSDHGMAVRGGWVPVLEQAGHYTRTESPDYADGGVTAASIEKEAAQPRPLTADDIIDEMADRFIAAYMGTSGPVRDAVRAGLVAMHAEPPARHPEAERIEVELTGLGPLELDNPLSAREQIAVADFLAERGVRVVTEEEQ